MTFRTVYITLFCLSLFTTSAYADYIQGHIVRIDRQKGEVDVVLCEDCTGAEHHLSEEHYKVHGDDSEEPVVTVVAMWFPRCFAEGVMIFARGAYKTDDPAVFEAEEVFPLRRLGRKDKTGVRSRFRHHGGGRRHHQGNHAE